jgi:hypothetical protein
MADYFGKETPKLGFGLMRLPKRNETETDIEQVEKMVDLFMEAGFTYFDTAFVYGTSEQDTKKALVDRHPRDTYTLATKLNAIHMDTEKEAKQQFYTSLERTGAGYFDYYLLHALMENNYTKYDQYGIWDFANKRKEEGLIRHVGFSYHSGPQLLDRLLSEHPEVDFVQLQINYADWENPSVTSRANYEVARRHGKSVVVMEPVKGGTLANPPMEVQELFKGYHPDMSYASWAIRFVASLDGIITVLSGMSNVEQMEDNLSYMRDFKPLNEEEQKIIQQAQRIMGNSATIPCTSCHYCTDGCPKKIQIPEIFTAANKQLGNGQMAQAKESYQKVATNGHRASDCVNCKQCERACPQHLPITEYLKKCAGLFE